MGNGGAFSWTYGNLKSTGTSTTGISINGATTGITASVDSVGGNQTHAHGATSTLSGTGAAFSKFPPTSLHYVFIKL